MDSAMDPAACPTFAYVGCYTNRSSTGIHVFEVSDPLREPRPIHLFDEIAHASMVVRHPNRAVLYSVSEVDDGELIALGISPDGSLRILDRVPSGGAAPCHVSATTTGVYVANYGSGTVTAYRLAEDGRFGGLVDRHQHLGRGVHARQDGPHAHCIVPGPDGRSVYAADLGTDRIHRYNAVTGGTAAPFAPIDETPLSDGCGPRHLAFHPRESVAFVVGELNSTVSVLAVDPETGSLNRLGSVSTLPDDHDGNSIAAEVRVHPDGRSVYVSNRGHDSIAEFRFDDIDRRLVPSGHTPSGGRHPRNFAIHPSGRSMLVANQNDDNLVQFLIEPSSGALRPSGSTLPVTEPVFVEFVTLAEAAP